jgi:hypothetical protein
MKKVFSITVLLIAVFAYAECPKGETLCQYEDGYSVMEAESKPKGAHNWMKMQHRYADFAKDPCERCGDETYKRAEDRTVVYVD